MQRMADASFGFEQDASFWYLTGIDEADWKLVISDGRSVLIAPDVSDIHRIFDGSLDWEEARKSSGVDEVISHDDGVRLINRIASQYEAVATIVPDHRHYDFAPNPGPLRNLRSLKRLFSEVTDCSVAVNQLRAIKQPEEILAMRKAIEITMNAFDKLGAKIDECKTEYEAEAELSYYFRRSGASGHAYDPIVAMGGNACTLHYVKNNMPLSDGLLLVDAGARYGGYAADITRTYGVGDLTDRHRAVHQAVVAAQREIIALLRPGLLIAEYHDRVDEIMRKTLLSLNLLHEDADYRKYFPHAISHGLGIDVHDSLGGPSEFAPGMVITVEPGIYISEESIGVRIEDDILITDKGHENLSARLSTEL